ncbi:disease resistance protein RGA5-like [Hordeum vulgare subsp. vulgare]|uniref:disease resistance protein RGA5-like n=1 Tax=Hordeum vulgare subsp. vulgare TaxID=112509 RepID=UPI001D1A3EB5|nr:disease resistance protein RGA5-like [Hordeum vulgare subsp. vulgare]
MASGIVTVASGVMNPLISKLTTLMGDEYIKFKGVRKQASFLEKELSAMNAALQKLELIDEIDPTVKDWRDHVREMSYDMENCIDDFMRQSRADDAKAGFIKKTSRRIKKLRERLRIADRMEELKTLALEANARRQRYNVDDWKPTSSTVAFDPRLRAVYQEADTLVGIDGPREKVATILMDARKKLKVVSIVGFGGLGKTTLAKQVYDKIGSLFDSKAFFSVSQRPDMTELLNSFQLKLGMRDPDTSRPRKVEDIIEELRQHLKEKRYLIVVDDVWDQSTWNTIKCAFPEDINGSRVIVTTRVEDVAAAACQNDGEGIYKMKPLSEQNSRMLLLNRVFGSKNDCPPQLKEVMAEILKKCHGLPLAVITIASLLANKETSRKCWESIRDSLGTQLATNSTLEEMKSILNLSYRHLPAHLRACLLYFGMYPEDSHIWKDDLVRQWIAEGLVSNLHGHDLEDVGRSYFNELINRSLIQPGKIFREEVFSCRVHDLMLDFILSKCDEDNFISVVYNYNDMARLDGNKYKVRRLSLSSVSGRGATYAPTIDVSLSQVRSFTLFWTPLPSLLLFKYLRVLNIEECNQDREATLDLTAIGQLFLLRYLLVRVACFVQLPAKLQGLVYLETLKMPLAQLKSIPSDMVRLSHLSYLDIRMEKFMSECVGNMKSLHGLIIDDVISVKVIMGLGELTNLRKLDIRVNRWEKPERDAFASSLGKLRNLKCLEFTGRFISKEDNELDSLSNPFPRLEEFIATSSWKFRRVPVWMGGLNCLRILELSVKEVSTEDVNLLGELPSLVVLWLVSSHIPKERAMLGTGLFPVLKRVRLEFGAEEDVGGYLGFEAGAMPNLRDLIFSISREHGGIPVGLEHLLRLEKVFMLGARIGDAIVSALRDALSAHPNHPYVGP